VVIIYFLDTLHLDKDADIICLADGGGIFPQTSTRILQTIALSIQKVSNYHEALLLCLGAALNPRVHFLVLFLSQLLNLKQPWHLYFQNDMDIYHSWGAIQVEMKAGGGCHEIQLEMTINKYLDCRMTSNKYLDSAEHDEQQISGLHHSLEVEKKRLFGGASLDLRLV